MKRSSQFRTALLTLFLSASLQFSAFAGLAGDWQGAIELPGQKLDVSISLKQNEKGQWSGSIDIPAQKSKDLPLSHIEVKGQDVSFQIQGIPGNPTFKGTLNESGDGLKGNFTQGGQSFSFSLSQPSEAATSQTAADQETLKAMIREQANLALSAWKTPGIGLAVIYKGELLLAEGFGFRDLDKKLPVTPETVFAIGSSSKAFTSAAIGMLVDQGELDWDSPVVSKLPGFALQDPIASSQATVRDLLSHRTGLPRHDLSWYGSAATREQLFASLKDLPPTAPLRSSFQYQNLMYMTAGILLEKLSGSSWEDFIEQRLFGPLEMTHSSTQLSGLQNAPDHAEPYRLKGEKAQKIPFRNIDAIGPAGSINSNITDMAKWLKFNLGDGRTEQTNNQATENAKAEIRLLENSTLQELHAPQVVVGKSLTADIPYMLYGLGWFVMPYRGETLVQHGGNIDGFSAMVAMLPEHNSGMVILSNKDGDTLNTALMFNLIDRLLKLEPKDWNSQLKGMTPPEAAQPENAPKPQYPQVKGTQPSHPLRAYSGSFSHPAYGELKISQTGGELQLNFRDFGGPLKHWHYDSFRLEQDNSPIDGQLLSFFTDNLGRITRLELSLEPSVPALSFTRQLDPSLNQAAVLKRYTGRYELAKTPIDISLINNQRLQAVIPGQPAYELRPLDEHLFEIKGLKGYFVRFVVENGQVKAVELIQPNGVFRAEKQ